jgi:hypothetical protein
MTASPSVMDRRKVVKEKEREKRGFDKGRRSSSSVWERRREGWLTGHR